MPAEKERMCPGCGLALDTLALAMASRTARCPVCATDIAEHVRATGLGEADTADDIALAFEEPWEEGALLVMEEAEAYPSLDEHHEEEAGARFRYPRGWIVTRRSDRVIIRPPDAARVPELLETAGHAVAITFAMNRIDAPVTPLHELIAVRLTFFARRHLLWQRRLTLPSGHPALAYCMDYEEQGHPCRVIAAAAARDDTLFFLDVAGLRPEIEALDQTCKRIVASLTL